MKNHDLRHYLWWMVCLFAFAVPQLNAQEVDDLQEYLDRLAAEQQAAQRPRKAPSNGESIAVPTGLTEVDLSQFTSYQDRKNVLNLKSNVKFTNGTITASASFSGGKPLLNIYSGVTVVLDASAGIDAGSASSSNCVAAVGIYGGSTFYQCGDVTGPGNGAGTAIYLDTSGDSYNYVAGSIKGVVSNPNGGVVNGLEGDPEAYAVLSEDKSTLSFYYDGKKAMRAGTVYGASVFRSGLESGWSDDSESITSVVFDPSFADYDGVTSTRGWFKMCKGLTSIVGLEYLNTENVTSMATMFYYCTSLESIDVSKFQTGNVYSMYLMFGYCKSLKSVDLSSFNTEKVTSMESMFSNCTSLTSIDLSGFKTGKVRDFSGMFSSCTGLTSLDVTNFDTSSATDIESMFWGCTGLTDIDLSNFNTENVTNIGYLFTNCTGFTSIDLSHLDTRNATAMNLMFCNCSNLQTIYVGDNWSTSKVKGSSRMFENCTSLVGGDGTKFSSSYIDKTKAYAGSGGYLTYKAPPFDLQQAIDAVAASENPGTADSPVDIQLPEQVVTIPTTINVRKAFVRLVGGRLKVADNFKTATDSVIFSVAEKVDMLNSQTNGGLFLRAVTIDGNGKVPRYAFFHNLGLLSVEDDVAFENINVKTGIKGGFYVNSRQLNIASGEVKVNGIALHNGNTVNMTGGRLEGRIAIDNSAEKNSSAITGVRSTSIVIDGGVIVGKDMALEMLHGAYSVTYVTINGGMISAPVLSNAPVTINACDLRVSKLANPQVDPVGFSGWDKFSISGDMNLKVGFTYPIALTSAIKNGWTLDWMIEDIEGFDQTGLYIGDSDLERTLVASGGSYELAGTDFEKISFGGVPDTLTVYYDEEAHAVKVRKKIAYTYELLKERLNAVSGETKQMYDGYVTVSSRYKQLETVFDAYTRGRIEDSLAVVKNTVEGFMAEGKRLNAKLDKAAETEYAALYDDIVRLEKAVDAAKRGWTAEIDNVTEYIKQLAAEDLQRRLQQLGVCVQNVRFEQDSIYKVRSDIDAKVGKGYFLRQATKEFSDDSAAAADKCTLVESKLDGFVKNYNAMVSGSTIGSVEDVPTAYKNYDDLQTEWNALSAEVCDYSEMVTALGEKLLTLTLSFPGAEDVYYAVAPKDIKTDLWLGYKSNRGFVLTSAGLMRFEQKEGADFYLKDNEDNYIAVSSDGKTLVKADEKDATVWTGRNIGDGSYAMYSKASGRYLGYSGVKVNDAVTAEKKAYAWTIVESELDDLQAFLNLLTEEEEESGSSDLTENDTLEVVLPEIDPEVDVPEKPMVFPKTAYPVVVKPQVGIPYHPFFPIPAPSKGERRPKDFHPVEIPKGSHVILDDVTFKDLVGGDHVIYVEGTVEININVDIIIENWDRFIHCGPTGRVVWHPKRPATGAWPQVKNEGEFEMADKDAFVGEVENTGTVKQTQGTIDRVVNRKTYYFTGGIVNDYRNYGTHHHQGGTVITARNFEGATFDMTGGVIDNTEENSTDTVFVNRGTFNFTGGVIKGWGSRLFYHAKGAKLIIDGGTFDFSHVKDYFIEAHDDFSIRGDYDYKPTVPMLLEPKVVVNILYKWNYNFNVVFVGGRPAPHCPLFRGPDSYRFTPDDFARISWQLPNKRWRWYIDAKENTIESRDEQVEDEDDLQAYLDWLAENQEGESQSTEEVPQELDLNTRDILLTAPVALPVGSHVLWKNGDFVSQRSWDWSYDKPAFEVPRLSGFHVKDVTIDFSDRALYVRDGEWMQRCLMRLLGDFYLEAGSCVRGFFDHSRAMADDCIPGACIDLGPEARFFYGGGRLEGVVVRLNRVVNVYATCAITSRLILYVPAACLREGFRVVASSGQYSLTEADLQNILLLCSDDCWGLTLDNEGYACLRRADATVAASVDADRLSLTMVGNCLCLNGRRDDVRSISVFSADGELVCSSDGMAQNGFDLGALPKGVYVVSVVMNDNSVVRRKVLR